MRCASSRLERGGELLRSSRELLVHTACFAAPWSYSHKLSISHPPAPTAAPSPHATVPCIPPHQRARCIPASTWRTSTPTSLHPRVHPRPCDSNRRGGPNRPTKPQENSGVTGRPREAPEGSRRRITPPRLGERGESRGGGCAADNIRHPLWPSLLLSRDRERRTQRCERSGRAHPRATAIHPAARARTLHPCANLAHKQAPISLHPQVHPRPCDSNRRGGPNRPTKPQEDSGATGRPREAPEGSRRRIALPTRRERGESRGGGCAADNIRHPLWPSLLLSRDRERRTPRCVRCGNARILRHRSPPRRTGAHAAFLRQLGAGNKQHLPAARGFRACGRDQRAFRSPFGNLRCEHMPKGFPTQGTFGANTCQRAFPPKKPS